MPTLDSLSIEYRIPQIIRQEHGFNRFIELICSYINEGTLQIYNILSNITPIYYNYSEDFDTNYLNRLCAKCGVKLNYIDNNDGSLNDTKYLALQLLSTQLRSDSSYSSIHNGLTKLLTSISADNNISEINIEDNLDMSYSITISNYPTNVDPDVVALYLLPNICGTQGNAGLTTTKSIKCVGTTYEDDEIKEISVSSSDILRTMSWNDIDSKEVIDDDTGIWGLFV